MDVHEKADKIIKDYETRQYRLEDLSKKYDIPIADIQKVTRAFGFEHTKKVTKDNRNEGQFIKPVIFEKDICCLNKYGDEHFEQNN